jgi:hypothetical protein
MRLSRLQVFKGPRKRAGSCSRSQTRALEHRWFVSPVAYPSARWDRSVSSNRLCRALSDRMIAELSLLVVGGLVMRYRSSIHGAGDRMGWGKARDQVAVAALSIAIFLAHECDAGQPAARAQRRCKGSEIKRALAPFHRICTPMHTSRNDVSCMITVIPVAPSILASRSANP